MHAFADRCGETCENYGEDWERDPATGEYRRTGVALRWRPITYDDVIEAGRAYALAGNVDWGFWEGEAFTQVGSDTAVGLFDDETTALFWEHWQTVTGVSVGPERRGTPFSCSC